MLLRPPDVGVARPSSPPGRLFGPGCKGAELQPLLWGGSSVSLGKQPSHGGGDRTNTFLQPPF